MYFVCFLFLKIRSIYSQIYYRIEFDAYRMDLENAKPELPQSPAAEDIQKQYSQHKELYEKLRADVAIKMQFLDENRVNIFLLFCLINFNHAIFRLK